MKKNLRIQSGAAREYKSLKMLVALVSLVVFTPGYSSPGNNSPPAADLTPAVDPFLGVDGGGNTLPGPYLPFGMVRVGPDCGNLRSNSGYTGGPVMGFSQVHISGSGGGAKYGNVLFRPTVGELDVQKPAGNRKSESATVGLYDTTLDSGVRVELSASRRAGFHRYTYPKGTQGHVVLDLGSVLSMYENAGEGQTVLATETRILAPDTVQGRVIVQGGWNIGAPYTVYFSAKLNRQPEESGVWGPVGIYPGCTRGVTTVKEHGGAFFSFDTAQDNQVLLKIGISYINCEKARQNRDEEIPQWDFDQVVSDNRAAWNRELGRITLEGATGDQQRMFYTALYHIFSMPTDRTGDNPLWTSPEPYYDDFFALWDTYRSSFPLFALIAPSRSSHIIRSLVDTYRHEGWMPEARSGNDNGRVQGTTSGDFLIADAILKGVEGIDYQAAYQAMRKNAEVPTGPCDQRFFGRGNVDVFHQLGYIPADCERSGSRTVDYAVNDFAVAQVAAKLGKTEDAGKYAKSSKNWRNGWQADKEDDGVKGFIMPRNRDGSFVDVSPTQAPMVATDRKDPYVAWSQHPSHPGGSGSEPNIYYEGNSWIYSLAAHHDVAGLIELCGGKDKFLQRLDTYFAKYHQCENEPGFFSHCLYVYAGRPDKTAEATRKICARFNPGRSGIPGNDDSGAMSSWLAFNMMGFYPNVGQDIYIITAPQLPKVVIHLENGKDFTIIAKGVSDKNIYVASATLNGHPLDRPWFRHSEIANGGTLEFQMSDQPTDWGCNNLPPSTVSLPGRS